MDEAKISIIVPIYNTEQYLDKCITSILQQSYTNIELLLIDDGSTDNCSAICDSYAVWDNRVRVIHTANRGISTARNIGLDEVGGEYIAFVDSDDYLGTDMIRVLYEAACQYSAQISVCPFESICEDGFGRKNIERDDISWDSMRIFAGTEAMRMLYEDGMMYQIFTVAWNKLYNRALFDEIRYPVGKIHEDEFVAYRLLYAADKVVYLPQKLYYYRQRADSITATEYGLQRFCKIEAYRERIQFCAEHHIYERESVRRYLGEYQSFIDRYCAGAHADEKQIYDKKMMTEYQTYRKYLTLEQRLKIKIRHANPTLWQKVKGVVKCFS